ncbi:hypothetical protein K504DRAFT_497972 [Pleomassaria siparia CBS 279.74]|uniref:Uncharacterized protein n=1 Tax=Pleomassaria siparia CBS 279.74 TaxID=1314801 RepID=A0A6G1KKK2_9PLEO|nr:hypothetical protein K504DRAFT_497972 [Pleomassaria siparia CBS 279.74]
MSAPIPNPEVVVRDFDTRERSFGLPASRINGYADLVQRAFAGLQKNPRQYDYHLHPTNDLCGPRIGKTRWESGQYFVGQGRQLTVWIHFLLKGGQGGTLPPTDSPQVPLNANVEQHKGKVKAERVNLARDPIRPLTIRQRDYNDRHERSVFEAPISHWGPLSQDHAPPPGSTVTGCRSSVVAGAVPPPGHGQPASRKPTTLDTERPWNYGRLGTQATVAKAICSANYGRPTPCPPPGAPPSAPLFGFDGPISYPVPVAHMYGTPPTPSSQINAPCNSAPKHGSCKNAPIRCESLSATRPVSPPLLLPGAPFSRSDGHRDRLAATSVIHDPPTLPSETKAPLRKRRKLELYGSTLTRHESSSEARPSPSFPPLFGDGSSRD